MLRPEADGRLRTDAVVASQAGVRRTGCQARGVPEMFGQRATGGFPQSMDPMHVPGSSGEYVGGVRVRNG